MAVESRALNWMLFPGGRGDVSRALRPVMSGEGETILGSCEKPSSSSCGPADDGRLLATLGKAGVSAEKHTSDRGRAVFSGVQREALFQDYGTKFFCWGNGVVRVSNQPRDI